jgi:hypothetical protein
MCLLLLTCTAFAQSDRGTLTGTISDPAGAIVAGAKIEATNTASGARYSTASTNTGNYTLAQLPAGTYQLTVSMPGFKQYLRPGVAVQVAATFRVDIALEVGAPTDVVTVNAEAPLLKTDSSEMSHNLSYDKINELPIITLGAGTGLGNIRNPLQVVSLLPGSSFSNDNTLRINGMPSSSQAIRIEGQDATNGLWRQQNQTIQSGIDAIQEVSVQTSNFAAEYGQAGGGYFNYTMRSGTNHLHGSVYNYNVNEAYNAGTPNTNDGNNHHLKNTQRRNDYGFTLGGPVYIPKVYEGKDRTFFFFNFEQFRENMRITTGVTTVPTQAYRDGDFSAALGAQLTQAGQPAVDPLGRPIRQNAIYNPSTRQTLADGSIVEDPFMGCDGNSPNKICTDPSSPNYFPLDPVALKIQNYIPLPNRSGLVNNYAVPAYDNFRHTTIVSFKIDHSVSSAIKLSGYYSEIITRSPNANLTNGFQKEVFSAATPSDNHSYTARFNYDHTIRPTMLLHVGVGLLLTNMPAIGVPFDQSTLGWKNNYFYNSFPLIGGLNDIARGGNALGLGTLSLYHHSRDIKSTGNASFTWVKGNHTLKFGAEVVFEGLPVQNFTRANGNYTFGAAESAIPYASPDKGLNSTTGFPYASFLLGRGNALALSQITDTRLGNHTMAFFAQDSWKITRKLTFDYGLRYDYATLLREQYGRMQNADFFKPNPNAGGLPGMMIYEATCNCRFGQNYPYAFGPRLGAAYQINSKTVLRAGGGIAYSSSPNNAMLSLSVADFYQYAPDQFGNASVILKDGNPRPDLKWPDFSNNYPFASPAGNRNPTAPFIYVAHNTGRLPRIFQWSIGLQREITRNLVVEAAYVGNRGAWWTAPLLASESYNGLTPEGLRSQWGIDITNSADGRLLNLPINNPAVLARFPQFANPNTAVYPGFPVTQTLKQALRPHPQWLGVPPFLGPPLGNTWYDSLQVKVTQRFTHGLDFQGAFTWQKELVLGTNSDTSYVTPAPVVINDVYNRKSNKQISAMSIPVMLVLSFGYTTPKLAESNTGMKWVSWLTRDWRLSGVFRYQSGQLMRTPASQNGVMNQLARVDNPGNWGGGTTLMNRVAGQPLMTVDPNCHCFDPTQTLVLNPNAWADPGTGRFGTSSPYIYSYRWQRQPSENLSLGREIRIKEKAKFEFRFELINVFNRMFWPSPVPVSAGLFGASLTGTNTTQPITRSGGNLTGGYGFVDTRNGNGARPRSGQIVARISF